jgi:hydrogenase expression/formation protein HypE
MGKIRDEALNKILSCIKRDPRVVVPPMPGYDAGVHLLGDRYMAVATDPCIGVPDEWFGWLLINYAASDVALFGCKPEFCTITLLGPPTMKPQKFQNVMKQVCDAADELDMAIVRGHTGTYEGVTDLLGVCTAYGTAEKNRLITPSGTRAGDLILCTKSVGLETLINLSLTKKKLAQQLFGSAATNKFTSMVKAESCVREALKLSEIGGVHAMHDATEGGFLAALNEMAEASHVGFTVCWEDLPVSEEVRALQDYFQLSNEQLLSMSSTGTLLTAVDPDCEGKVIKALNEIGVSANYVGEFKENKERILARNGQVSPFPRIADDPYTLILG